MDVSFDATPLQYAHYIGHITLPPLNFNFREYDQKPGLLSFDGT